MPTSLMRVNLSPLLVYFVHLQMASSQSHPGTTSTVHEASTMSLASFETSSNFTMRHQSLNLSTVLPSAMILSTILTPKTVVIPSESAKMLEFMNEAEIDAAVMAALSGPLVERLMTEATCLSMCTSALYRCVETMKTLKMPKYTCEMDPFMLGLVVVSALITGITLPIACIICYVFGLYGRLRQFLRPPKPMAPRLGDVEAVEKGAEPTFPSMQSTTALISTRNQPNFPERMYKKKHSTVHRYSQPQLEFSRERAKSLCESSNM